MMINRYQALQSSETTFTTYFTLTKKVLNIFLHFPLPPYRSIFQSVPGMNVEYSALWRSACEIKLHDF